MDLCEYDVEQNMHVNERPGREEAGSLEVD